MTVLARILIGTALASGLPSLPPPATAQAQDGGAHVLLLSIDGLHFADIEVCKAQKTCPNLKSLTEQGFNYTNATTTKSSDSFPGRSAQLAGGAPKSTGIFYDDSYDGKLYSLGCASGPAAEVALAENVDTDMHSTDGGVTGRGHFSTSIRPITGPRASTAPLSREPIVRRWRRLRKGLKAVSSSP
jgi:hypothetical protein